MAKPVRTRYVYKKYNRWWRYLPRRNDGHQEFDFEQNQATPEHFGHPMTQDPPKLWLAWLYREPTGPSYTLKKVAELFGENAKPGKMHVFKNTADVNEQLWSIKHLIELKPMTFPDGEPREEDVPYVRVQPDGQVRLEKSEFYERPLVDETKQFAPRYLSLYYKKRDVSLKDVYPDTVYNPANITILD